MSGLASAISLPVLARMPWWSSQFNKAYLTSPPFLPRPAVLTRYASKQACSRMTKSRLCPFATPPLGTCACTGSMCGFAGAGMGLPDEAAIAILRALDEGRGLVGLSAGATLACAATGEGGEEESSDELASDKFSSICMCASGSASLG